MGRVVTFGEIMLRLEPEGYNRFIQAEKFLATYGGAEANVAVSLSNFGINTSFVTKLPQNKIGEAAVNSLRRFGVDVESVLYGGNRVGIYFLEKGASQRPSLVIYDREYSSMQKAQPNEFDWELIFEDAEWFHFTGITPALGDNLAEICLEACKIAKKKEIKISCDLNYRQKLWSREKAKEIMSVLAPYIDLCIANEEDAFDVFGIEAQSSDVLSGTLKYDGYKTVAKQLMEKWNFNQVAITLRTSLSAFDNRWAALLYDGEQYYISKTYDIHIVDRVGGGDSFGAGLIYASLMNFDAQKSIEFAVASSCLKHTIEGDYNMVTTDEVLNLMNGDRTGRVKR